MKKKKNILEICNQLWIWWTEKVMQIFCKYLDKDKYNVFACWIFKWWERKKLIKNNVLDLLVANGDIGKVKDFIRKNMIDIIHWHSISQNPWIEFEKSIELLKFCRENNIKIIETSPFSLYNEKIDDLLDIKLFVSKTNLIKYFWKFWKKLKNKGKYSFLYNPLDIDELEKYRLNKQQKKEVRKKYGIWENDFVIWMVWRDDLWRWDNNFLYIIKKLKEKNNVKFLFRKLPNYYKKYIIKNKLEKNCIFLDLTAKEKDISITHQILDINLHDTRLGETYWLSIAESIFYNKYILCPYIDYKNKYIYDRNSWQFEFLDYYQYIYFYKNTKELFEFIVNYKQKLKNDINIFDIFNPKKIIFQFEKMIDWNLNEQNKEVEKYKKYYESNYRKKEKYISYFYKNIKGLYFYFINKFN